MKGTLPCIYTPSIHPLPLLLNEESGLQQACEGDLNNYGDAPTQPLPLITSWVMVKRASPQKRAIAAATAVPQYGDHKEPQRYIRPRGNGRSLRGRRTHQKSYTEPRIYHRFYCQNKGGICLSLQKKRNLHFVQIYNSL